MSFEARLRLAAVAGFIALASAAAGAAGGITTDGYWWNDLPNDAKPNVMAGAAAAYAAGWQDGVRAAQTAGSSAAARTALQRQMPSFDGRAIGAYVDRMNGFFLNHGDVTDINVAAVLACVQDRPSRSCDAIAAGYRQLRSSGQ